MNGWLFSVQHLEEDKHHSSLIILDSSFIIRSSWDAQSFIVHHSSFVILHSSFIIHHPSSFGIHHLWFIIQKSMKNRWKIYQKSIKNRQKIDPKSTKIGLGPPWSRLGGVQAVMEASKTPLRVNSWFLLSLSNEIAILAKNGAFVREWEQCQKWPRKVKFESIPKVRRVLADAHRLTADPSHVRSSFIIQHSSFGWETVPSVGLWNGCVLSFSIRRVLCSGGKRLGLLRCGTVQFCLFRCNNVEFISRHSSFINQSRLICESILKVKQVPWRFSVCVCVCQCVCVWII